MQKKLIKIPLSASKNVCMINIADKTHKTSDKNKKAKLIFQISPHFM